MTSVVKMYNCGSKKFTVVSTWGGLFCSNYQLFTHGNCSNCSPKVIMAFVGLAIIVAQTLKKANFVARNMHLSL